MYTLIVYITSVLIGSVIWAVRLEGKVNEQKSSTQNQIDAQKAMENQKHQDLKELVNTRFDATDQRLGRIERALNGALHGE